MLSTGCCSNSHAKHAERPQNVHHASHHRWHVRTCAACMQICRCCVVLSQFWLLFAHQLLHLGLCQQLINLGCNNKVILRQTIALMRPQLNCDVVPALRAHDSRRQQAATHLGGRSSSSLADACSSVVVDSRVDAACCCCLTSKCRSGWCPSASATSPTL